MQILKSNIYRNQNKTKKNWITWEQQFTECCGLADGGCWYDTKDEMGGGGWSLPLLVSGRSRQHCPGYLRSSSLCLVWAGPSWPVTRETRWMPGVLQGSALPAIVWRLVSSNTVTTSSQWSYLSYKWHVRKMLNEGEFWVTNRQNCARIILNMLVAVSKNED